MAQNTSVEYTYEKVNEIKDFLIQKYDLHVPPKIGIICGSGLGSMGDSIEDPTVVEYDDIPDFPVSTVEGHSGRLIFGRISGVPVVCMQGRFHYYEGYPLSKCVMPVRLMRLLGASFLIASNAAGAVNRSYEVGDVMLQRDHLNLMGMAGVGPLVGSNDPRWGPRFFAMTRAYNPEILHGVRRMCEEELGMRNVRVGVYTCMGGPNYETVAEVRALGLLGVDAAGMSTVHEVIAARHCGLRCFAFSLITNVCSFEYDCDREANSSEVLDVAKSKEGELRLLIENVVRYIGECCLNDGDAEI